MSAWQRIGSLLGFGSAEEPQRLAEAHGVTIDQDDEQWRRLTGDAQRDITPMTQQRMQKLAVYQWESNLIANRLIELPVAFLLAKGIKIKIDNEELQTVIDRHWRDGLNAWDIKLPKKVRELSLFGEQCWPVFVNEQTGFVRVGYLDPALIEHVVTDPDNVEQPIGIVTKKGKSGKARLFRVICNVPEEAFSKRAQAIRETFTTGDCFFFKVNDLCSGTRGRSDLLAQIDWLDAYDQFLFGELDRADFMRAFVWDVTLKDASEAEVKERAKKITTPKPGSVRVHNDSEEWDAVVPELKATDGEKAAKLFRNHIMGGGTLPEHWYGGASDVNRATGESMMEPTKKILEMRQSVLGYALIQVMTFVIHQYAEHQGKIAEADLETALDSLQVEWPEMIARDTTKYAAALQQATVAAHMAVIENLITKETAIRLIQSMAAELGVPFDVEKELAAVGEQAEKSKEDDRFVPQPPLPAET